MRVQNFAFLGLSAKISNISTRKNSLLKVAAKLYQSTTDFIRMKGGRRVKMNVGKLKVSKVQGAAVHDQLGIRLRNYRAIVVRSF